jgi:enoyl-CoA hydratase
MKQPVTEAEAEILVARSHSLGRVTLNRPKVLNSLNLGMVRSIGAALDVFEHDPDVAAVLVDGAGDKAFCAGGDIRMIYESGKAGTSDAETFWREEYRLNARIHHFPKPYVAVLDGLTMGGGVGVSAHGSHRIATERLRLAMPETGIGFFPDVGATWLLSRTKGELGTYLGLSGDIIGPADAIAAGLVDVMVPRDQLAALRDALSSVAANSSSADIGAVIRRFAIAPPEGPLAVQMDVIDRCFAHDTVEAIFSALEADASAFAAATLATLRSKSPSALTIALRMLREGRQSASLEACLDREFAGAAAILTLPDFYEGVRAAILDKDRNPQWLPASLGDVDAAGLARFFKAHAGAPFNIRNGDNEDA